MPYERNLRALPDLKVSAKIALYGAGPLGQAGFVFQGPGALERELGDAISFAYAGIHLS